MSTRAQYDYVIVGAGSAGCVLANRLTENEHCHVLLIEAGGEARTRLAEIPGAASWMQGTALDWAFTTTPQRELFDRRIPYPRGRAVGGTSILNYMVISAGITATMTDGRRLATMAGATRTSSHTSDEPRTMRFSTTSIMGRMDR